jgi:signal transduction histidine kinase
MARLSVRSAALELTAWTLLGVFFSTQTFVGAAYARQPLSWGQALGITLAAWYVRAAGAPLVRWLARREPIATGRIARGLIIHLPASVAIAAAETAIITRLLTKGLGVPRQAVSPVELHTSLLTYWVLVGVTHGLAYYHRSRDREAMTARLEAQLSSARLALLRAQLNPHFLFNTLHDLSQLIHEDPDRAEEMVDRLSELLRRSLRDAAEPEVALGEELEFLRGYLAIETMRFQDRLTVQIDVDPAALDARVPSLILQPLVENAIRHGIAPRAEPGRVEVHGRVIGEMLRLVVRDDGPGVLGVALREREGLGLANTRERLRTRYGDAHRLELVNRPGGGLDVVLEMPYVRVRGEAVAP